MTPPVAQFGDPDAQGPEVPSSEPTDDVPAIPASPSEPPPPPGARRWFFRFSPEASEGAPVPPKPRLLGFVALGERTLTRALPGKGGGTALVHAIGLAMEEEGRVLRPEDVDRLGLAVAPVEELHIRATLVRRTVGNETSVWWLWGSAAIDDGAIDGILRTRPDFRPIGKLPTKPRVLAMDRNIYYRATFGQEPTTCSAYVHPAPVTGDFYDVERCFVPSAGMLGSVKLSSVWGSYELELMNVAH